MPDYRDKKAFFDAMLTIYGRKPVLEALEDESLDIYRLHLSKSNKPADILRRIEAAAARRGIDITYHDKQALSRISKNAKQDQGVALDIRMPHFTDEKDFLSRHRAYRVMALDGVTNPQNVGMIVRSAAASNIDALIVPKKGTAKLDALVIKASAGTLFRMPIIRSDDLIKTLRMFKENGATLYTLDSHAPRSYKDEHYPSKTLFILGNETDGVSDAVRSLAEASISVPMRRGVESLNVAVTAALLAFLDR